MVFLAVEKPDKDEETKTLTVQLSAVQLIDHVNHAVVVGASEFWLYSTQRQFSISKLGKCVVL